MFPSAAGFHTSQTFFTDDDGVYVLEMRDAQAFADRADDGTLDLEEFATETWKKVRKIQDGRLKFPAEVPYTEAHTRRNHWGAAGIDAPHPGSHPCRRSFAACIAELVLYASKRSCSL